MTSFPNTLFACYYQVLSMSFLVISRFRSMTQQYFRKADGIIVVYDVTTETSFKNVRNWMHSVQVCLKSFNSCEETFYRYSHSWNGVKIADPCEKWSPLYDSVKMGFLTVQSERERPQSFGTIPSPISQYSNINSFLMNLQMSVLFIT